MSIVALAGLCSLLVLAAASAPAAAVERILCSSATSWSSATAISTSPRRSGCRPRAPRSAAASCATFRPSIRATTARASWSASMSTSVTRDGAPETCATEGMANGVRVRIGSADRSLRAGPHDYVIRYRTTRQIGFFSGYDELYWNATGTGWTFADRAGRGAHHACRTVCRSSRAPSTPARRARAARTRRSCSSSPAASCSAPRGRCRRTTASRVAVAGRRASSPRPLRRNRPAIGLQDNRAARDRRPRSRALLGFYGFAWLLVGRDPPTRTIIPLFGPPDGMSRGGGAFRRPHGFRRSLLCGRHHRSRRARDI